MGCKDCSTDKKKPFNCKNNGTCVQGCNKFNVFDWLSDISYPDRKTNQTFVEVQFKNNRKDFFANTKQISLRIGDSVITQASQGYDVGKLTLVGPLVRVQMNKKKVYVKSYNDFFKICRIAETKDIQVLYDARRRESSILKEVREKAFYYDLKMKISDVEIQGDNSKATIYYTAETRVDFRRLVRDMAFSLKIKIEMKQIGLRQEASRLGGLGDCGRELCCSSWLTNLVPVNIGVARYQNLSLDIQKLTGQCGKLKCCLNYELDTYADALKDFPSKKVILLTEKGKAFCQKIDIFGGFLWYNYSNNLENWIKISARNVQEIIKKNKAKEKVLDLEHYSVEDTSSTNVRKKMKLKDVIADNNMLRFDEKKTKGLAKKRRRK